MIRRPYRHQRARSQFTPAQTPPGRAIAATFTISTNFCRLTFDAPVVVSGTPVGITRQAAGAGPQLLPTAIDVIFPTVVDIHYAANVVATDVITINANVPEIRGNAGGFIAAAKHTF